MASKQRLFRVSVGESSVVIRAKKPEKVRVELSEYGAEFHLCISKQRFEKIGGVGNAQVAEDFCVMLEKLGHEIERVYEEIDNG